MLVLDRVKGDWLFIGDSIKIKVIETRDNSVILGVLAPKNTEIFRGDIKHKRYYNKTPQRYLNNPRKGNSYNDVNTNYRPVRHYNG